MFVFLPKEVDEGATLWIVTITSFLSFASQRALQTESFVWIVKNHYSLLRFRIWHWETKGCVEEIRCCNRTRCMHAFGLLYCCRAVFFEVHLFVIPCCLLRRAKETSCTNSTMFPLSYVHLSTSSGFVWVWMGGKMTVCFISDSSSYGQSGSTYDNSRWTSFMY